MKGEQSSRAREGRGALALKLRKYGSVDPDATVPIPKHILAHPRPEEKHHFCSTCK